MLRTVFSFIFAIHGLIHLLGFVKEFNLSRENHLTGKTLISLSANSARFLGVLWLIACILFLIAAASFLIKKEGWWIIASVACFLSQALIVFYWHDAKFGTILNIVILILILITHASLSFEGLVKNELKTIRQEQKDG